MATPKKAVVKKPVKPSPRVNKVQQTKKLLVAAMTESKGIVTDACLSAKVDRTTFYNYYNADPEFKAEIDAIEDIALDFVEGSLHRQINNGEVAATIFYLKTKGKRRGYIEKQQIEVTSPQAAIEHYQGAINFAVRFALSPGEKTHAAALAMLADNAKGNADLMAIVAELGEKMGVAKLTE